MSLAAAARVPEFRQDLFDSEQFGCAVYKLWLGEDTPEAHALSTLFDASHAELVCCFSAYSARNIEVMQQLGFRFISVRHTYELNLASPPSLPPLPVGIEIRLAGSEGPPVSHEDLVRLAETIGATSRYFKDPGIPRARSLALYVAWLSNSLYAGYADAVVLAMQREALVGIHTVRVKHGIGYVDLIGVLPAAQGAGLGGILLSQGLLECHRRRIQDIRVVTEGENVNASRFYQRRGFLLRSMDLVWHRHLVPR